jgi:ligand-binding sensor domain-containing protein/DNA-binding CsgD family transcriptional regulator
MNTYLFLHQVKSIFKKRLRFLFFLLLLPQGYIMAIHPCVRNFSHKTTHSGTQNWDIIQYENNWMYFANNNGLLEFDGNKWTVYPISNYTNVRSLYYHRKTDRIYAGAFNEFGYYERNETGLLQYFSLIDKISANNRNFNEIWNISSIDNIIYFQGDKDIFQYKNGRITHHLFPSKIDCSAAVYNSFIVCSKPNGAFFLNGNMFIKIPNSEMLQGKKVCAILPFQKNKVLFVTEFNGLFVFDGNSVEVFKTDIDRFLSENQVFCAGIKDSKLAIGTVRKGLVVKDFENNSNFFSNTFSGLQNNTILSMAFDNQNNLWLGLDKGIDYVLIDSPVYELISSINQIGTGYCSLMENNNLYLGTNQGLYHTNFPIAESPEPANIQLVNGMQGQVWSMMKIDNTIFCGTDHGAYYFSGKNIIQIPGISGTWNFRKMNQHPDCIIGSSYQGFFVLRKNGGKWELSNFLKGFSDAGGMFEVGENDCIWFSHWMKGISKLTLNQTLDSVIQAKTYDTSKGFPTIRNNTLFLLDSAIRFSSENGFYAYDKKKDLIIKDTKLDKLFNQPPHSVRLFQNNKGDLWCISTTYIAAAFKENNQKYRVDSISFNQLKTMIVPGFEHFNFVDNDHLIVSTEDGFSWINLRNLKNSSSENNFQVSISNVYLTSKFDSLVNGYVNIANQKQIPKFDHKHNSIRFEFTAPEYRKEGMVQYSYKLEDYDTEWSTFSPNTSKEYTKIKKGSYTFRVRAKSQLNPKIAETSYQFIILPAWYETTLAYIIYSLVVVFLLILLLKFIKKSSQKGALKMKEQKEQEMKEQGKRFLLEAKEKEKEIIALKNQRLQYELRHKSQELADSTMNLIRKNEILTDIIQNLNKISSSLNKNKEQQAIFNELKKIQEEIKSNIEHDNNWKKFEENFDLVYENYLKRLTETYPNLTVTDKKICAYLKMGLSSKDIAPLLNMSYRSVEMSRYRLRKKMNLDRNVSLSDFLQNFR